MRSSARRVDRLSLAWQPCTARAGGESDRVRCGRAGRARSRRHLAVSRAALVILRALVGALVSGRRRRLHASAIAGTTADPGSATTVRVRPSDPPIIGARGAGGNDGEPGDERRWPPGAGAAHSHVRPLWSADDPPHCPIRWICRTRLFRVHEIPSVPKHPSCLIECVEGLPSCDVDNRRLRTDFPDCSMNLSVGPAVLAATQSRT